MPVLAPHPVPRTYRPAAVGTIVVVGALPLFFVAGWPIKGWVIAAVLWVVSQGIALVLLRLPLGMGNLAGSGAVAMGRMFRSIAGDGGSARRHGLELRASGSPPSLSMPLRFRRSSGRRCSRTTEGRQQDHEGRDGSSLRSSRLSLAAPAVASAAPRRTSTRPTSSCSRTGCRSTSARSTCRSTGPSSTSGSARC